MDLVEKYIEEEGKNRKTRPKTVPEKKIKGKILPTKRFLSKIFGPEVMKDLKKGVDYQ